MNDYRKHRPIIRHSGRVSKTTERETESDDSQHRRHIKQRDANNEGRNRTKGEIEKLEYNERNDQQSRNNDTEIKKNEDDNEPDQRTNEC